MTHTLSNKSFILAVSAACTGLTTLWVFPALIGQNGGGGFMLIYVLALLFVAGPTMMAELAIGQLGRGSPIHAIAALKRLSGRAVGPWSLIGYVGLFANVLMLSVLCVFAAEAAYFSYYAFVEGFSTLESGQIRAISGGFEIDMATGLKWVFAFLMIATIMISFKSHQCIERLITPIVGFVGLGLAVLLVYAGVYGDLAKAVGFMLGVTEISLSVNSIFLAIGLAFLSVFVGTGAVMLFGSHACEGTSIVRATGRILALIVGGLICMGLIIHALIFSENINPITGMETGTELLFVTLPVAFAALPGGDSMAGLFFLLVSLLALITAYALMAPLVSRLEEAGLRRPFGAVITTGLVLVLSIVTFLSLGPLFDLYPLEMIKGAEELNMSQLLLEVSRSVIAPICGVFCLLLVGWGIPQDKQYLGVKGDDHKSSSVIYLMIRYSAPGLLSLLILYKAISLFYF